MTALSARPKLLDLFCGAGGCSVGYHRAGFDVVGVDIRPMPRYPFEFHQADALTYPLDGFDVIHASPPCQKFSRASNIHNKQPWKKKHPDLIETTRQRLIETGKPYVIENVEGSPLKNYVMLCGSMFGLRVYRHRLFECNPVIFWSPFSCNHNFRCGPSKGVYHTLETDEIITCVGHNFQAKSGRIAMGIDWMTRDEIAQAIPPAYTEWIGKQLLQHLRR